jgi:uncharacterized SAM-binding protein YcdF (DUF218 family)
MKLNEKQSVSDRANCDDPSSRFQIVSFKAVLIVSIFVLIATGCTYVFYGKLMAEKLATQFVMPIGLVWLILLYGTFAGFFMKSKLLMFNCAIATILVYLAANPALSELLLSSLEEQYPVWNAESEQPLETLIVLGGGVDQNKFGAVQFNSAGDRVGLAARLYLMGHAKFLVTTGDAIRTHGDPSKDTVRIFKELRIPESDILELAGKNTYEEMQSILARPDLWQGKRAGVISSAFHMPRVMRLAKKAGVTLIPIPANFRCRKPLWTPTSWFPNAESLSNSETVCKELLGMLMSR